MNKKYERYINYIVNDIEAPYFINMKDNYGLSEKEYELVLSKVYNQPVTIKGRSVYDVQGNIIYRETSNGFWEKSEYDTNGNKIYVERSDGYWEKSEYDTNGNKIYFEDSNGFWVKREYDTNGNEIYYENSYGNIEDNRYE
jgi:uncharacterized membrane protein